MHSRLPLRRLGVAVALAGLLDAAPVRAEEPQELIVTGTRLAIVDAALPNASTVVRLEEIEARNDASVVDLLRTLPGLQVVQSGAGNVPQVFLRGGEPNFTVFLLDGIKVNDPNNTRGGSFDLASLNLADLARVEIIRGPQSSIYGSDGLAGVINFISRAGGETLEAMTELEAGGTGFHRGTLQLGGPAAGSGGFSLQATTRDDGESVRGSRYRSDSFSGRLRLEPTAAVRANLYARYAGTERSSFPETSGGPRLATLRTLEFARADDVSLGGDLDWQLNDLWSVQGLASLYQRHDRYASPGVSPGDQVPPNGAANDLERQNFALRATLRPTARIDATFGVDLQRESGKSDGYVDFGPEVRFPNSFALDRKTVGVFAEGRYQAADRLILQASLRHDEPDEVAGETTGRLGAIISLPGDATRLRVNGGTGFKLPSFFALGSPIVGEPGLRPEKSRSADLGVTQALAGGRAEVDLTLFYNEYRDLIDFDPETFRNVNRDTVVTQGLEFNGRWQLSPTVSLRAQATHTQIEVRNSDRQLLQRPKWRGGAALRWAPAGAWLVDLDWLHVGETLDSAIPTGILGLDSWDRVDLGVGWSVSPGLRLTFAVDNLFDANYEEAIGFPAAGIRPRLGVRYQFNRLRR